MSRVRYTVSSGSGPLEVRRFVHGLAAQLVHELARRGVRVEHTVTHGVVHEPSSVDVIASGAVLDGWLGTHVLVMRSARRDKRDRKRWYAGVSVQPFAALEAVALRPEDVAVETCRASGAGGQHVNKTESAVRAIHLPTGLSVRVESERSQHQNRASALDSLARALRRNREVRAAGQESSRRLAALHVERGRPVLTWRCDEGGALRRATEEDDDAT
jgi:peptide chain release factor